MTTAALCALWLVTTLPLLIGLSWVGVSLLPSQLTQAHDLGDLIVWAVLNTWIYVVPVFLIGLLLLRSKSRNGTHKDFVNAEN